MKGNHQQFGCQRATNSPVDSHPKIFSPGGFVIGSHVCVCVTLCVRVRVVVRG
jgi:hypothetical protein